MALVALVSPCTVYAQKPSPSPHLPPYTLEEFKTIPVGPITRKQFATVTAKGGPSYEQTRDAVIEYILRIWKDPDSAKDIALWLPVYNTRATIHKDWLIIFAANGKNSFGAYVGIQVYVICWANGSIDYNGQANLEYWKAFVKGLQEGLSN
jgi:hypothetical protein